MAATLSLLDGCHLLSLIALGITGRITSAGRPAIMAAKMAMYSLASLLRRGMRRICIL
jgi:hypothetical protein